MLALIGNISGALSTCCAGYSTAFVGTWTALGALETDITTCCSAQQANFVSTWTIINSLSSASSACGPVTVIHQSDIDPVNGYIIGNPGNYCLAEDIVSNADIIISITASNVFLDMQNHEILCSSANPISILIYNVNNISITNGTFTSGSSGILVNTVGNITTERCVFQGQQGGVGISGTSVSNHTIAYCIFRDNVSAITMDTSDSITIYDCVMCNSTAQQVAMQTVSNLTIQNCIQGQSQNTAIQVSNVLNMICNNCIISGVTVTAGSAYLIVLTASSSIAIQSCLLSKAQSLQTGVGAAISIQANVSNCTISDCYMYQNTIGVLRTGLSSEIVIDRCIVSQNVSGLSFGNSLPQNVTIQNTLIVSMPQSPYIGIECGSLTRVYNCTLLNNGLSITAIAGAIRDVAIENCIFNRPLQLFNSTINSIVRNNEAFSCGGTAFINTSTSNAFYNNNAFNAGSPAYSLSITNTFNVNTPDPLTGTAGDILSNLTNTN